MINNCNTCKKDFEKTHNKNRIYKFCSLKCSANYPERKRNFTLKMQWRTAWNKGMKGLQPWMDISGFTPWWNKGMTGIYTEEVLEKNRIAHIGKIPYNKGMKMSDEHKKKLSAAKIGKCGRLSNWWKHWLTKKNLLIRGSLEIKKWRKEVFSRDWYICQKYKIKGWKLVAHHILNFSKYESLRFTVSNWITLSERAHLEFHKRYWKINNTKEQLALFLNNI